MINKFSLVIAFILSPLSANAEWECWNSVAAKYSIDKTLLFSIAQHESGLNSKIKSKPNKDGTYDIGLMQINSSHLPILKKFGISEQDLYDPCINLDVGAWILAGNIQRYGPTWNAVGAYNAKSVNKRVQYATNIESRYQRAQRLYSAANNAGE